LILALTAALPDKMMGPGVACSAGPFYFARLRRISTQAMFETLRTWPLRLGFATRSDCRQCTSHKSSCICVSCTVTLLSGKVTVLCPVESSPHLVICLSLDRDDHISDHSATSSV